MPMYHVAIVEVSQIMPDMMDLFERFARDPNRSNAILITGPSKTADIEMNVVTGVHGPNVVKAFVLTPSPLASEGRGEGKAREAAERARAKRDVSYFDSIEPEPLAKPDASAERE